MSGAVIYREYQESDFPALVQLVEEIWGYEEQLPKETARLLGQLDLLKCLRRCSFSRVAVVNCKPVGFLFGAADGPVDHRYDSRIALAERALRRAPLGPLLALLSRKLHRINRELLRRSGGSYGAELSFFALRLECRGYGVGRRLYSSFLEELRRREIRDFCVFTDDRSNYGFYEHFGLKRRAVRKFGLPFLKDHRVEFYLYEGSTEQ